MSSHQEDLDLLLSLQDRVLETPPGSPSNAPTDSLGYLSDEGSPRRQRGDADLSVFRDVVQDCLNYEPKKTQKAAKAKNSRDPQLERFSGLRIRNQVVSTSELSERLSDIRFVRLPTIEYVMHPGNVLKGDTLAGCWATVGVLTEKGSPKTSSIGQQYALWKVGCLDENTVSLFLFGEAYLKNSSENVGTVFALFNCSVRKDAKGPRFSLSVSSPNQVLKIGASADYGVCKGKRKDGLACTLIINKRQGVYCQFHKSNASERYSSSRTELKGGNFRAACTSRLNSNGIYLVDPSADKTNSRKPTNVVKVLSVEALKQALRNSDKVTTNAHSQGIRFLNKVSEEKNSKIAAKTSILSAQRLASADSKRKLSSAKQDSFVHHQLEVKRRKHELGKIKKDSIKQGVEKMIEIDMISSDED